MFTSRPGVYVWDKPTSLDRHSLPHGLSLQGVPLSPDQHPHTTSCLVREGDWASMGNGLWSIAEYGEVGPSALSGGLGWGVPGVVCRPKSWLSGSSGHAPGKALPVSPALVSPLRLCPHSSVLVTFIALFPGVLILFKSPPAASVSLFYPLCMVGLRQHWERRERRRRGRGAGC